MSITRRSFTQALGTLAAALACSPPAARAAETPIRMLVGYTPGGAADSVARIVADGMRDSGLQVVVENRPGAAGSIAAEQLRNAAPDGKTLLMSPSGAFTLAPHVLPHIKYAPLDDFAPVGSTAGMGFALAVAADSPIRTLEQFLAFARQHPDKATYGTPGSGTSMHFIGEILSRKSGVPLTHIPYRGGSTAVTDTIGGTLLAVITTLPNLLSLHRDGRLRILAITNEAPLPALPDVPTFQSLGFNDLVVTETFLIMAPPGIANDQRELLHRAIDQAVRTPRVSAALQEAEYEVSSLTPAELTEQLRTTHARWKTIVDQVGFDPGR